MSLIQKEKAIEAIEQRATDAGGMARTYYERAIQAVLDVPDVVVEKNDTIKWSVANAKPRKKGFYLVYCFNGEDGWVDIGEYVGRGNWIATDGTELNITNHVTHWMPLPDAP